MRADIQVWESERIRECVDREICRLSVKNGLVHLDGVPVGEEIRTRAVSVFTPNISPIPHIRKVLIPFQRACADDVGLVAEGRDMGSVVFPDALLKIFLTAHEEIRAARRFGDYRRAGNTDVTFEAVLDDLRRRDRMDERRKDSPLVRVPDAIVINTGTHNSQQVEEIIVRLWQERSQENST
jgi:CMP/dCMP kinase